MSRIRKMNNPHHLINYCQTISSSGSTDVITVGAALASAIAAIAAAYIAYKQSKTAKDAFVYMLHEKYLKIMDDARKEEEPFSDRIKQIYANFYEQVCWLHLTNKLSKQDVELFVTDFLNPRIVGFVRSRRKTNKQWYKYYWQWYTSQQRN